MILQNFTNFLFLIYLEKNRIYTCYTRWSYTKNSEFVTHEGEECGYIIKGKMKITLGNKEYLLEEGDSFYFNSTIPHVYENYDDEVCISVWAMTPPSF